jgi:hypothetical protein
MQQGLMIIRWSRSKSGSHVEAMKLADDADAHFRGLAQNGVVAGHEWIANITGEDGGMVIVRGDLPSLMGVASSPEFGEIHLRGILHLERWRWDLAFGGDVIDEIYPGWRQMVGA